MSSSLYYMSGYGVEMSDLAPLLNEEISSQWEEECDVASLFEELTDNDDYISWFSSEDGQFLYIRDCSPYAPIFNGVEEINAYFYKRLKQYMKEDVTVKDLSEILDDVFSYDFC